MNDTILAVLFYIMAGIIVITPFYPWRFIRPHQRKLIHLPLALIPLFIAYELLMPIEINIRVDLLLLYPAFFVVLIFYVSKLCMMRRADMKAQEDQRSI